FEVAVIGDEGRTLCTEQLDQILSHEGADLGDHNSLAVHSFHVVLPRVGVDSDLLLVKHFMKASPWGRANNFAHERPNSTRAEPSNFGHVFLLGIFRPIPAIAA